MTTPAVLAAVGLVASLVGGLAGYAGATRATRAASPHRRPLFTGAFWALALERAAKSAAQGALLTLGADSLDLLALDWRAVAGAASGMAVLSLLTSIGSAPLGPTGSPSLVAAPPLTPPAEHEERP